MKYYNSFKWKLTRFKYKILRLFWLIRYKLSVKDEKVNGITIVVVGRNDNYGGDFSKRLEATIDWNYSRLPNPELIYVEWNPIENNESDCNWIAKRYSNAKCFIVPNDIHRLHCENEKLPVMEYFAKNLGIREASNDWVLLVNADVFLGFNTISNMNFLNRKYIYGTHYNNIKWQGEALEDKHINDKSYQLMSFPALSKLEGVVGNFIMAHKSLWNKSKGYDEKLKNVRKGVDSNGVLQLFYYGGIPMVLGDHYHLDHNESLIHGSNDTHGDNDNMSNGKNIPYDNKECWGLADFKKTIVANKIWKLEKI